MRGESVPVRASESANEATALSRPASAWAMASSSGEGALAAASVPDWISSSPSGAVFCAASPLGGEPGLAEGTVDAAEIAFDSPAAEVEDRGAWALTATSIGQISVSSGRGRSGWTSSLAFVVSGSLGSSSLSSSGTG